MDGAPRTAPWTPSHAFPFGNWSGALEVEIYHGLAKIGPNEAPRGGSPAGRRSVVEGLRGGQGRWNQHPLESAVASSRTTFGNTHTRCHWFTPFLPVTESATRSPGTLIGIR